MEKTLPLVTEALELYSQTAEIPLWKPKGVSLTSENILDNILILSHDLADYFEVRHAHLFSQNISKL